jgi:hypothetical protein
MCSYILYTHTQTHFFEFVVLPEPSEPIYVTDFFPQVEHIFNTMIASGNYFEIYVHDWTDDGEIVLDWDNDDGTIWL